MAVGYANRVTANINCCLEFFLYINSPPIVEMNDDSIIHSLDFHIKCAHELCRLCSNKAQTFKQKMKKVILLQTKPIDTFGVKVGSNDVCDKICTQFYVTLKQGRVPIPSNISQ